ncbi:MAG: RNA-binding protein [Lentisphaeria bacterium]|nr:RNA-binding protein [Lentisphaeria bacterium]
MNIYVGNLPYSTTPDELQELFSAYGEVAAARIVNDRETGRPKGFGFVEMPNDNEANAAIEALNGNDIGGRKAVVNEARPREARPRRKEW